MRQELAEQARKIIEQHPNSILITVDEDGRPVDRIMWTARVDDDMTVYYATARNSAKIKRIQSHPGVEVMWLSGKGYVALQGIAEVVDDRELLDSLWRDSFAKYFPGGKDDPKYVAIRVIPGNLVCVADCDAPIELVEME